jgi:hypothetical protein
MMKTVRILPEKTSGTYVHLFMSCIVQNQIRFLLKGSNTLSGKTTIGAVSVVKIIDVMPTTIAV